MKMNEKTKWRAFGRMLLLLIASFTLTACPSDSTEPEPPTLELNPSSINFTKNANDSHQLTINTNNDAEWTIYDSECSDWLSLSTKEGRGSMTITLTTKNENKKGKLSVSIEVKATNEAGEISKRVSITRDPGIAEDCYARQTDAKLVMSYGMACAVESGNATSYFKYKFYTADAFRNYDGNDDAIAQEATKSDWTRENIPSNGGGVEIVYNNCQPSTDYVFVTVAYDREGNRGEINTYPFATKDAKEDNQPRVAVVPLKKTVNEVHDNNNGPWYKWDTNVDGGGNFYITYACASDKIVETMQPHSNVYGTIDNKIGLLLAWNIFMESKNDNLENAREVTFNKDNASGREKLFGKAFNNKTQWIEYRSTDKYLQIVTWAFKGNDFSNPSGVVSDVLYHVDNGMLVEVEASYLNVSPTEQSVDEKGGSFTINVNSNESSWTTASSANWCRITSSTATSFIVEIDANTESARSAVITVKGASGETEAKVNVTQEGVSEPSDVGRDDYGSDKDLDGGSVTYTLTISPTSTALSAEGGKVSINVTSNDSWTVTSNQSWLTVSPASGSNNGTFSVNASANTNTSARSAVVTVKGGKSGKTATLSVTQNAGEKTDIGRDDYGSDKQL